MQKAVYDRRGPVPQDVIRAVEFDKPILTAGQVLVEVLAAPINPSDLLTLTGEYGMLPPLPAVGGNEGVGRVAETGPEVTAFTVGQTVLLPVGSGTWTTHLVTDAKKLIPLPSEADPQQLSMMTVNPPAAFLMLSEFVDLKPGEWVIQNAANSGVGGYLMQLAKIRGFRTVNVVRRESAVSAVQDNGGDVVLVDGDHLYRQVAEATGRAPIRLGIDAVAGAATGRLAACLGEGATLVNYGMMGGEPCVISPHSLIFHNIVLRGFWLAKWFQNAERRRQTSVFTELVQLIAADKLKAKIHAVYGIGQIKEAVEAATQGGREGKILLAPNN